MFSTADADPDAEPVNHARGWLTTGTAAGVTMPAQWPPAGAEPVPVDGLYGRMELAGLDYGPLFKGIRAAWRLGPDLYTEVALPDDTDDAGFVLHPALFDAALQGALVDKEPDAAMEMPFTWTGVRPGRRSAVGPGPDRQLAGDRAAGRHGRRDRGAGAEHRRAGLPLGRPGPAGAGPRRWSRLLYAVDWVPVPTGPAERLRLARAGSDLALAGRPRTRCWSGSAPTSRPACRRRGRTRPPTRC